MGPNSVLCSTLEMTGAAGEVNPLITNLLSPAC